jgi:hypothetical protein
MRYGKPYWFNGIYKISRYTFDRGYERKPYYHVYYITGKNWGDYVGGRPSQYDKHLTFKQCVQLAENHAKTYEPTKQQLKQAEIAMNRWLEV